jgi:hypothetical protein
MQTDLLHHLIDPGAVVLQHLKVGCVQDDFTDGFNVTLGILQKNFFKCTDIEKGKKRDSDQQDNTGPEDVLADQTLTERTENRHNRSNK